ncbi:MAG: EI24 domain-containing protein [Mariprofundales bacterium]|nr:EI24 domain-containing protein [Mariprofundales bacterium]
MCNAESAGSREMIRGVNDLLAGLKLLWHDQPLRGILLRIAGLLALLMVVAAVGAFWLVERVAAAWVPTGDAWYWQLTSAITWLLALLLSLLMALLLYLSLATVIVAPWLESVALRAAVLRGEQLSSVSSKSGVAVVWQAATDSLRPLWELALYATAALLLWLIPLLGPMLATVIWGYGSLRYLCFELLDTHASLMQWSFQQRRDCLQQQRWYWLGFGGLAALALMVPLLNLLVLPAAVAGLRLQQNRR